MENFISEIFWRAPETGVSPAPPPLPSISISKTLRATVNFTIPTFKIPIPRANLYELLQKQVHEIARHPQNSLSKTGPETYDSHQHKTSFFDLSQTQSQNGL